MNDRARFPVADGPAEQTAERTEVAGQVGAATLSLRVPESAEDADAPPVLLAEWALWGKEEERTALHVLRCSRGPLSDDDFREIITRYATGVKEELPQYTVCWIPADRQRQRSAYLAVAIHELADDPERSGGRSQYVAGREVEYVRLFCFQYAKVAELAVTYTDLVEAVRWEQLPPGQNEPIRVRLSPGGETPGTVPDGELAPLVASLLLTSRPVCVLDADNIPADGRLAFIDEVLSLLPFGLRATLSAATWASPTAQDLKLRLFFSTARRDDGSRTCYVTWARPHQVSPPYGRLEFTEFYREWLRDASEAAIANLARMTDPVRFTGDDFSGLLARLPRNKSVEDTFDELAASLRAPEGHAVPLALKPLKLCLRRPVDPADRAVYKSLIEKYQLLGDYPRIHHSTIRSVYSTLLRLAFGDVLFYADYCEIERMAGWNLSWPLRRVLVTSDTLQVLPGILAAKAGPGIREEELMEALELRGSGPESLLAQLDREIGTIQPRHLPTLADFALRYLRAKGIEPQAELVRRGYLSRLFTRAYPDDLRKHQLAATLRYVYGGNPLSRGQITQVFAQQQMHADWLAEEVVKSLTTRKLWRFVEQEAACARLTQAGHGEDAAKLQASRHRTRRNRSQQLGRQSTGVPGTIAMIPKENIVAAGLFLLAMVLVCVVVYLVVQVAGA